jgi:pimeloyl-ACP methyl ester carboxylesterase
MPVARVNDIELNYMLEGDGEDTIVLINGLADDHQTWVLQMDDFLAAGYRVLRFDNRGIGASSKPAGLAPRLSRPARGDPGSRHRQPPRRHRFHTPARAAVAFVAPSIAIGVISTAFTDPGTASGFLSTFGILGLVIMYLAANVALIVDWARLRRRGVHKNPWLWVVGPVIGVAVLAIPVWGDLRPGQASPFNTLPWLTLALIAAGIIYALILARLRPRVLEQAPALLEGDDGEDLDPLAASG